MPIRFRRRFTLSTLTAIGIFWGVTAAWLPASAQAPASAPLKIGVIGPFTGPSSDFGLLMLQGVQLATEQINAGGGYLGRPLALVVKDDQGNPDMGLKGSQELVAEGVTATIGFCNTGVAAKSLEVFQNAKMPLLIPCASTMELQVARRKIGRNLLTSM